MLLKEKLNEKAVTKSQKCLSTLVVILSGAATLQTSASIAVRLVLNQS